MSINIFISLKGLVRNTDDGDKTFTEDTGIGDIRALYDIAVISHDDIWAVGDNATLIHWDGISWTEITGGANPFSGATDLFAIWAFDANNIWAGGQGGELAYYDGVSWVLQTTPNTNSVNGIMGVSATRLWAVTANGDVFDTTDGGADWDKTDGPTVIDYNGIWAVNALELFIAADGGVIVRSDDGGVSWNNASLPTTEDAFEIWGYGLLNESGLANDLFAVGHSGKVWRYDGTSWSELADLGTDIIRTIHGREPDDFWVGGGPNANAKIWHYDGVSFTLVLDDNLLKTVRGLHIIESCRIFAVGGNNANEQLHEGDLIFDTLGSFSIPVQIGRQPTTQGEVTITGQFPTGTSFSIDVFGSDTGEFLGEEIFLFNTTDTVFTIEELFSAYRFDVEFNAVANATPVFDALQLKFLG